MNVFEFIGSLFSSEKKQSKEQQEAVAWDAWRDSLVKEKPLEINSQKTIQDVENLIAQSGGIKKCLYKGQKVTGRTAPCQGHDRESSRYTSGVDPYRSDHILSDAILYSAVTDTAYDSPSPSSEADTSVNFGGGDFGGGGASGDWGSSNSDSSNGYDSSGYDSSSSDSGSSDSGSSSD